GDLAGDHRRGSARHGSATRLVRGSNAPPSRSWCPTDRCDRSRLEGAVMALITEDVRAPETQESTSPPPPRRPQRSKRAVTSSVAVIAALAATGLFVRSALSSDDERPAVVVRGDTKDHPLYDRPVDVVRGDTKDHPLYRRPVV